MSKRAMCRAAPLALAVMVSSSVAGAQEEPSAADMGAARALGQDGVKLADAGNCQDALDKLARAEKIFHAPTTLARLGECQVQMGKLVEGTENLNRVSREALGPAAPQAFRDAQERARKVLAEAKPKIARLKIAVAAPSDAQLTVKLDGEGVPVANLNTNRPTDPGDHVVEASAPGYKTATARVKLGEGSVDSVALTLELDPAAVKSSPAEVTPAVEASRGTAPAPSEGGGERSGSRVPAYVALGVGGVGLAFGTVFGVLALGKKSDLDEACPNKSCLSSAQQDTVDSGQTFGTISTIGFGVGIVGVGVGTVLLLTSGSRSSSATASAPVSNPMRIRFGNGGVEPVVGAGRFGFSGTF